MRSMHKFLRNKDGASAAEFAIVVLVFVVLIFATIDFGRLMWDWTRAEAATRAGVRYAVVNAPVAGGLSTVDGVAMGLGNGNPIPVGSISPDPVICTSSATTASCNGFSPYSTPAFDAIVTEVWKYFPAIGSNPDGTINLSVARTKIVVEYRHIGLGYVGNPYGSDIVPLVTVKLQNMVFNFITPGLIGFVSITMPDFAAALTGEDLAP